MTEPYNYYRREIAKLGENAPDADGYVAPYRIKIAGEAGATRWLTINADQLHGITEILATDTALLAGAGLGTQDIDPLAWSQAAHMAEAEPETPAEPIFYTLPAKDIEKGMSTADGQDFLEGAGEPEDGYLAMHVYTPRSDDADEDERNRREPECRMYQVGERVNLAVFSDTATDGTDLDRAELDGTRA